MGTAPGWDGVHTDVVRGQLDGEVTHQADYTVLRCCVVAEVGVGDGAGEHWRFWRSPRGCPPAEFRDGVRDDRLEAAEIADVGLARDDAPAQVSPTVLPAVS